jgi:type II secretory pathway pseudopilin PulG
MGISVRAPRGASLIEALIVVSIVGMLVSLILPAVLAAREASRRALCANRLRQVGLALAQYEASEGRFPAAYYPGGSPFSVHTRLLPYFGFDELYARIPYGNGPMTEAALGFDVDGLLKAPNIFACPSDSLGEDQVNFRCNLGPETDAVVGFHTDHGPFSAGSGARVAGINDGLSRTVFFSERIVGDFANSVYTPSRDLWYPIAGLIPDALSAAQLRRVCSTNGDSSLHRSDMGRLWFFGGLAHTAYNHVLPPNSSIPDCGQKDVDQSRAAVAARSFHNDGVQCLMGDGSVTFVSSSISLDVWVASSTRSSGESTNFNQ